MKYILTFLFLVLTTSAFGQTYGVIDCGNNDGVASWERPGSIVEIKHLPCGQRITIIGFENGFAKVRISENLYGYVDAKHVRSLEMAGESDRRIRELEAPIKEPQQQRSTASIPNPEPEPQPTETALSVVNEMPRQSHEDEDRKPGQHRFGLGFETSNIYYDEPNLMRNKGFMYGVSGDYTYRPSNFMLKVDGRFSLGNVDYWSNGTGTANGLRDYNFETRFSVGYDLRTRSRKAAFTPFIGLGYRYLFDGESGVLTSTGHVDYDRKQHYLYSPIGMETMFHIGGNWELGLTGEYDLFWHGWNHSELNDVGLSLVPLKFDQKDGWGARGSIKIVRNFGKRHFIIEPYLRYWNINESDLSFDTNLIYVFGSPVFISNPFAEPHNTTTEWGLKVGIRF